MSSNSRNLIAGAAIVGLGALAAYFSIYGFGPRTTVATQFKTHGVCLACKTDADVTADATATPPLKCPKCGEAAVYPWFYCNDCGKQFVPKLTANPGGPPQMPTWPTCPACGKSSVGQYLPGVSPTPKAVLPLPAWKKP